MFKDLPEGTTMSCEACELGTGSIYLNMGRKHTCGITPLQPSKEDRIKELEILANDYGELAPNNFEIVKKINEIIKKINE